MDVVKLETQTVLEFIELVSNQNHAMAGAVITLSAAQAVALGQACLQISLDLLDSNNETVVDHIETLKGIKTRLLKWFNRDANAIKELVALREAGQELSGQQLLCRAPAKVGQLSIQAAGCLEAARVYVNDRVKDDLEMSINLLCGAARAAVMLLDSNLRIWPEKDLLNQFEPILIDLEADIEKFEPITMVRS